MTIMYPYYGEEEKTVVAEQLQLFDPSDYVDMDGFSNIEVDIPLEQLAFVNIAAERAGLPVNEWINKVLKEYLESEDNG